MTRCLMALWSSAPPTAPPTSPRLLGTRFSPVAWELGLQEVADASNWEWQTASVVASSLIVLSTCLLLAAWAAMRCLAHLLSRVAKAADDAAAADEAALLSPSLPRSQERSGSDIECHSVPVGVCAETSSNLPTSGALTTASILLPRNVQLPAPHCTTRGLMPLAGVPAAPSLPATPTAARRSGEPARSPPSRKYLEAYCRAQSLTRPAPAAAASHNGAGAVSDGDSFGAPVFRQDQFGAPVFAPSGPNRESVFASSLGLPLVPPLLPRRQKAAPPGAAAHYSASPQSGLSELPELSRELSRELSGESPVSPRPYSPGGTATAGYSPPTFIGRSVGVVLGMHEGEDTRKVPIAGVFLPQIEFELSRLAREAAERVAPAVRAAKEEIAKHFEDIEEAAAAEAKARVAAAAEAAAAEAAAAEAAARKAAAAAEAIAKEAVAEAGPNKAGAEATADVAAEVAEVAEEVAAVAVTRALSRSAAAEAAAAEVAAAEKAAAEAAAHAEKEKAAAVKLAAEKAAQAQAQAQMVEAEKAAAERCAKARRASAAKAREKATAQPVAVAVPSPVRRAAARQVLLAVRKRSLAAFDEINLATLDLAIEQLQLDLATISQPQLDLATVAWSEQSSDHHGASACVPVSKESSIAKLATVGSRMEVLMSLDGS